MASMIWRRLFLHTAESAADLALFRAGRRRDARIAITAITTSSSIRVNALLEWFMALCARNVTHDSLCSKCPFFKHANRRVAGEEVSTGRSYQKLPKRF